MHLHYREWPHAVAGRGKYGYFHTLLYRQPKRREIIRMETELTGKEWPLFLKVKLPVHNYEDMEFIVDGILDLFDSLRGEHGEDEVISPSSFKLEP